MCFQSYDNTLDGVGEALGWVPFGPVLSFSHREVHVHQFEVHFERLDYIAMKGVDCIHVVLFSSIFYLYFDITRFNLWSCMSH